MADDVIRVRVISEFFGKAMKVYQVGESVEFPKNLARELIASNRVVVDNSPPKPPSTPKVEKESK